MACAVDGGDVAGAAQRAVVAAEEANKAAWGDPTTPRAVLALTARMLEESQALAEAATSPRALKRRQSFAEFTSMLGEEVKEAAEESAERSLRMAKSIIEQHFHVDEAFCMLGPLQQGSNPPRDARDWLNAVALVPAFQVCWWMTIAYFMDVLCIVILPQSIGSPEAAVQHQPTFVGDTWLAKLHPEYGWLMGACLLVELNTWLLFGRRRSDKSNDNVLTEEEAPLVKSLFLVTASFFSYVSWFLIRLCCYPYMLALLIWEWYTESKRIGMHFDLTALMLVVQCIFILRNVQRTTRLLCCKLKGCDGSKSC